MNFLPQFTATGFALAGLLCAAGPIVIHLLNRQRFKTVNWAAMDFLLEAVKRNRKIMQLRDILLLILRTAAVLLFGLALARPFFSYNATSFDSSQPLHAVVVIDNSLSMAMEALDGNLLDKAKTKAIEYIDQLPPGSRTTIIPLCGSSGSIAEDAYRTKSDAKQAIEQIDIVARSGTIRQAGNLAAQAAERVPQLSERIVFFSDQQLSNWNELLSEDQASTLPEMQVIDIGDNTASNTWVSDLIIEDALADVDTPTNFVVRIRHQGDEPRDNVQVLFKVNNDEVDAQTVSFESGSSEKELTFRYTFDMTSIEPGAPHFVPVEVSLPPDRLHQDDTRSLIVPVVASLPVVFIDQMSDEEEDPSKNQFGATWTIRRLLAPRTSRQDSTRQLIKIRHLKHDELSPTSLKTALQDSRLAVIAGVEQPTDFVVEILREYLLQGGQLLIAAGNDFNPAAWNQAAWQQGNGILPLPLADIPLGEALESSTDEFNPFRLRFDSLRDQALFKLADQSESQLLDLYSAPLFFKAVIPQQSDQIYAQLETKEQERLAEIKELEQKILDLENPDQSEDSPSNTSQLKIDQLQQDLKRYQPDWLLWQHSSKNSSAQFDSFSEANSSTDFKGSSSDNASQLPEDKISEIESVKLKKQIEKSRPVILAEFENQVPYLVERTINQGKVVFASSSLDQHWTTLPSTNAILIFDRLLREMLVSSLPSRNFEQPSSYLIPIQSAIPTTTALLFRPDSLEPESLPIGFLDQQTKGVKISGLTQNGIYQLQLADNAEKDEQLIEEETIKSHFFSVLSPSAESEPAKLTREDFVDRQLGDHLRWVAADQPVSLSGAQIQGQDWWKYLVCLLLVCLALELLILAKPSLLQFTTKTESIAGNSSSN